MQTYMAHGCQRVSWVQDTLPEIIKRVEALQVRASENPALYADKLAEYDRLMRQLYELVDDMESSEVDRVVKALSLTDDGRLQLGHACAIWDSGDRWVVFGRA